MLLTVRAPAADWDAVAVFLRPQKAVVLLNERPPLLKLARWIDWLGGGDVRREFVSADGSVRFVCGGPAEERGCTFRIQPGPATALAAKTVTAQIETADLAAAGFAPGAAGDEQIDVSFLNSNGDRFRIFSESGRVLLSGQKR